MVTRPEICIHKTTSICIKITYKYSAFHPKKKGISNIEIAQFQKKKL